MNSVTPVARFRSTLDRALGILHTVIPAILVVVAFGTITYAVLARHLFDRPLATANEIAQLASVWIVMLGCGLAVRRGTMIVIGVTPPRFEDRFGSRLEPFRRAVHLIVLLGIAYPCLLMLTKTTQEYEALGISRGWGVAALPVGFLLVALVLLTMPRSPGPDRLPAETVAE